MIYLYISILLLCVISAYLIGAYVSQLNKNNDIKRLKLEHIEERIKLKEDVTRAYQIGIDCVNLSKRYNNISGALRMIDIHINAYKDVERGIMDTAEFDASSGTVILSDTYDAIIPIIRSLKEASQELKDKLKEEEKSCMNDFETMKQKING